MHHSTIFTIHEKVLKKPTQKNALKTVCRTNPNYDIHFVVVR